jgi:hypothetical protein
LLILVACAVGRLEQTGGRDVRGLYARLVAHRGRAVIAAGWPIADNEAAVFATILVDEYLAAVNAARSSGDPLPPFLRARALNRARRRALAHGVTPHLAGAFELYGLG